MIHFETRFSIISFPNGSPSVVESKIVYGGSDGRWEVRTGQTGEVRLQ